MRTSGFSRISVGLPVAMTAPFTITVMVNGTVIATGNPAEIRENPEVRTAYLGEEQH